MADIVHDLWIKAPPARVFQAVSAPADLDRWWTKRAAGEPRQGATYELWFGPQCDWRAMVTRCAPDTAFELALIQADPEWTGTRVGFALEAGEHGTRVRFHHRGWPEQTEHYRVSCYCWAMYLRILKRYLEHGEDIPYERRLDT